MMVVKMKVGAISERTSDQANLRSKTKRWTGGRGFGPRIQCFAKLQSTAGFDRGRVEENGKVNVDVDVDVGM